MLKQDRWSLSVKGRNPAPITKRGKSGLHRARCWVTPSLGNEKESATENIPPRTFIESAG